MVAARAPAYRDLYIEALAHGREVAGMRIINAFC